MYGKQILETSIKQFRYYKALGDKTIGQLPERALFLEQTNGINSIAVIVKHLSGNMLSRWTDFLTTDGEKEWRNREAEFEADIRTKAELLEKWEAGWEVLLNTLTSLKPEDVSKVVYIRNQGHTVLEAILRQISHYAYHVGQMVYIGKLVQGKDWESLSIPKGESKKFNQEHFKKEKNRKHFTEDFLDEE